MMNFGRIILYNIWRPKIISTYAKFSSTLVQNTTFEKLDLTNSISKDKQEKLIKDYNHKDFSKLYNAQNVSALLQNAASVSQIQYAFKAFEILDNWNQVKPINLEEVTNDPNFSELVSTVQGQGCNINILSIVSALKNLHNLGIKSDTFIIESLESDLLWHIQRTKVKALLYVCTFQNKYQDTAMQRKVLEQTINCIQKRWNEINSASEIAAVYENYKLFSLNLVGQVDDKVVEMCESFPLADLHKIFCSLGKYKRRATPVLRSISYQLFRHQDRLNARDGIKLLCAMNSLNFIDQALLDRLGGDLLPQIEVINNVDLIESLLICMGQMRWLHSGLLDCISQWIAKNISDCNENHLTAFLLTLSTVSHTPLNFDELLPNLLSKLQDMIDGAASSWLDIVWSLVVLDRASCKQVASVFEPSFIKQLPLSDPEKIGIKMKLLNISGAIILLREDYGDVPIPHNLPDVGLITHSRKDLSLSKQVHKTLHNFLPPPKYILENTNTSMGFLVDAIALMDKRGKPLPVAEFERDFGGEGMKGGKPLPKGTNKIALMVWNFRDFTTGSQSLTGPNKLIIKLLIKKGFKVVQIPHFEVNSSDKTLARVKYFERKIQESLQDS